VHLVYDEDGGWLLLAAYTEGFWAKGIPEVHIRAFVDDAAAISWGLGAHECLGLLDDVTHRLAAGELAVGDQFERSFDDGAARLLITLGDPVPPARVRARSLAPKARVIPLTWQLRTAEDVRRAQPLPPAAQARQRAVLAQVLGQIPAGARPRPPFRRPARTSSFDPGQQLGPLSPVVRAQAAAFVCAPLPTIARFVDATVRAHRVVAPVEVVEAVRRAARRVGRGGIVEPVIRYAEEAVAALVGKPGSRRRQNLARHIVPGVPDEFTGSLLGALVDGAVVLFASRAVADVVPRRDLLAGLGPWQAAHSASGFDAGPPWHAAPQVLAQVSRLLAGCDQADLAWLARQHDTERLTVPLDGPLTDLDYARMVTVLEGLAITGASGCPPASELIGGARTANGRWLLGSPDIDVPLTRWAACVSALLSERMYFAADEVAAFAEPVRSLFPTLTQTLNSPLVAESA